MNEKEQLMRKLQALQFAMVDLGQFLDTHPDDADALAMYKKLNAERAQVKTVYEQSFGSLVAGENGSGDYWDWVAAPFPFEGCQ